jgi:DNA invertase Pin-like site-specific DNA recombinase
MAKELTQREMASMGGKALAKKYGKRQRRTWGRRGGRPAKLTSKKLERMKQDLAEGHPHNEIAGRFGVSLRTVGRVAAKMRKDN